MLVQAELKVQSGLTSECRNSQTSSECLKLLLVYPPKDYTPLFVYALTKEQSRRFFSRRINEPSSLLFDLKDTEGAVHVIFVVCCLQMLF